MPPPWLRRSALNRQIAFGLLLWAAEVVGDPTAHKRQHHRLLPELEEKTIGGLYDFTGDNDPVIANKDVNLVVQQHWEFSPQEKATALRFSPISAHVITIHKHGEVRLYDSVDVDGEDYKTILNIEDKVYSADDHGMVGFAFDPQYGVDRNQYAYLFYMSQLGPAHAVSKTTFPNPAVGATRPLDWGDNNCPLETNCEKLSVLTRLLIDLAAKTAKEDAVLLVDQCGGSATHGVGAINFASTEEMIIMYGEHAQYALFDYNMPADAQYALFDYGMPAKDACYDPAKLPGQGCFHAQRDDFIHGKGIRIAPDSYRNSTSTLLVSRLRSGGYAVDQPLVKDVDYTVFGKGFRNPFRSFIAPDDVLWACGEYRVTLNNRMQGTSPPSPRPPSTRTVTPAHEPAHARPARQRLGRRRDDVTVVIEPGESHTFTYKIPCNHSGGLHWYHPHHHGSTTLQAGAGAAGLLLVEDNPWLEGGMPEALAGMRQAFLQIQQLDPNITANVAAASQ
ncbi:hypothetical protein JKP88DRAFT_256246, partial [Tribonema minus]